jgi:hypothetical protein
MSRAKSLLMVCSLWICYALPMRPAHATTTCAYNFSTGSENTLLRYCVTVNGNIPQIETPSGIQLMTAQSAPDGEGYGICNESPAVNYTDYGVSDTGNWGRATLLSQTSSSIGIARTTSDGHWTLTQTITKTSAPSIKLVMALKNNQSVQKVAYLVRFAAPFLPCNDEAYIGGLDSALGSFVIDPNAGYGLILQNVGTPPFGFWEGYAQTVTTGPNACAFAYNAGEGLFNSNGSIEVAYVGPVPAGGTKTVTLTYRGL